MPRRGARTRLAVRFRHPPTAFKCHRSEPLPELSPTTTPLTSAYWPATAGAEDSGGIRHTTIGSVLRDAAARAPGKAALIDGDQDRRRQWTYAQLLADAERAALGAAHQVQAR